MKRVLIFYCLWFSAASYADWIVRTDFQIKEYLRDHGVFRDDDEIIESLVREAEQGSVKAQLRLGSMFDNGAKVFQNYVEAIKWYEMAAVRGSPFAQFNLGFIHEHGLGEVPRDYVEAVKWYKLAAETEWENSLRVQIRAQFNLGYIYANGFGEVPRDYVEAVKWYRMVVETEREDLLELKIKAQLNLGYIYANGFDEVPRDYVEAVKWYRLVAETERKDLLEFKIKAQLSLGFIYENGFGEVPRDYVKAAKWYKMVAVRGSPSTQFHRGVMYEDAQDYEEAAKQYKMVAVQDSPFAQFHMAVMNKNAQDYVEAVKWYRMVAETEREDLLDLQIKAQLSLGKIHEDGFGEVPQDYVEAAKWYKMAAARDSPHARFRLGFMYEQGLGVPKNKSKAFRLYRKADTQGSIPARDRLELMLITAGVKHNTSHANQRRRCRKSLRKR